MTRRKHLPGHYRYLCLLMLAWSMAAWTSEIPEVSDGGAEAWLVTFAPGEIYWERFGHNAIWLREPAEDIDHTFNFGFFDFEQKDFFLRFLRGRMMYFSVAQPATREFEHYRQQNRSIRLQKLDLDKSQYLRLRNFLINEVKPENRNYRYDYYLNNCSTRIRDALDIALDGELSERTESVPASQNFRDHTRRLTQMQFWYYIGLEIGLGYTVDRPISRWDEMFIPMVVADEIAGLSLGAGAASQPLVLEDMMLFTSSLPLPPSKSSGTWYRYLLLGLIVLGVAWLSGMYMPKQWLAGLCHAWLLISGTSGLALAFLWLATDHSVAGMNANLLLFNPLVLLALVPALNRFGAVMLAGGIIVSILLLLLPRHQFNVDVLAMLAPLNLGVAFYFWRHKGSSN